MSPPEVLIADDDRELCELLQSYLEAEGFAVRCVFTGAQALGSLRQDACDLLILDVMLPELDGFSALRRLREFNAVPVLMLTAKGDEIDRIVGLELGADDYLAKPCNPRELLARVRAILRRTGPDARPRGAAEGTLRVGPLAMQSAARRLSHAGRVLELTSAEFDLMAVLMRQAGQVVNREQLSREALGREPAAYDRSVDVHISNLRRKLAEADAGREWIVAVRGKGYQLLDE